MQHILSKSEVIYDCKSSLICKFSISLSELNILARNMTCRAFLGLMENVSQLSSDQPIKDIQ